MLYVPNGIYNQITLLLSFRIEFLADRIESLGCIRRRVWSRRFRSRVFGWLLCSLPALPYEYRCQNHAGRNHGSAFFHVANLLMPNYIV
jgi:hypothetical protein